MSEHEALALICNQIGIIGLGGYTSLEEAIEFNHRCTGVNIGGNIYRLQPRIWKFGSIQPYFSVLSPTDHISNDGVVSSVQCAHQVAIALFPAYTTVTAQFHSCLQVNTNLGCVYNVFREAQTFIHTGLGFPQINIRASVSFIYGNKFGCDRQSHLTAP